MTSGHDRGYTQPMQTAISLPDDRIEAAKRMAGRPGHSRREFCQRAVDPLLDRLQRARTDAGPRLVLAPENSR